MQRITRALCTLSLGLALISCDRDGRETPGSIRSLTLALEDGGAPDGSGGGPSDGGPADSEIGDGGPPSPGGDGSLPPSGTACQTADDCGGAGFVTPGCCDIGTSSKVCVDLDSNELSCGSCGNACNDGQDCVNGNCVGG